MPERSYSVFDFHIRFPPVQSLIVEVCSERALVFRFCIYRLPRVSNQPTTCKSSVYKAPAQIKLFSVFFTARLKVLRSPKSQNSQNVANHCVLETNAIANVPNPTKVIITLEELGIPYIGKFVEHADLKQPAYEAINPNEKYHTLQWQHYQSTAQGSYWGQLAWFQLFHHEPLESARKRYVDETVRIVKVLDKALEGREWLVGDRITYADLAFVSWSSSLPLFLSDREEWDIEDHPNYKRWNDSMLCWEERV
ncbi:hypothetical protein HYFRA_00005710 [Hymenoscyphus fraxineus]|uniref:GST C-terminal domain-containing protein n=1 Tax=Hymenoscyphus fraxineus TaxID=746836 RepID=A0A9N9PM40_9HELO|nr:hypothetical protein HYFRA_00005710 [Hymenoscyphus fraxineus]